MQGYKVLTHCHIYTSIMMVTWNWMNILTYSYIGAVLGMWSYKLDPNLSPLLLLDHDKSLLQVIDFVSEPIFWWFESTSFLYVHIYIWYIYIYIYCKWGLYGDTAYINPAIFQGTIRQRTVGSSAHFKENKPHLRCSHWNAGRHKR